MTTIQPRFEFRVWGDDLADAAARIRAFGGRPELREGTEIYVLCAGVDDVNPKIRAGTLDVKVLHGIEDVYELWEPWLQVEFPVAADVLMGRLFPRLGLAAPIPTREEFTLPEFLAEIVDPHPALTGVEVHKHREIYAVPGAFGEVARVRVNGHTLATVTIESTDLELLDDLRRRCLPPPAENESFPKAIKRALGLEEA